MRLYDASEWRPGFEWPQPIRYAAALGLCNLRWWYLLFGKEARWRIEGLVERYPSRKLVPFAIRRDNDDVACFEAGHGGRVFVVHDYADPGWERRQEYDTFWDWFRDAVDEMIRESGDDDLDLE